MGLIFGRAKVSLEAPLSLAGIVGLNIVKIKLLPIVFGRPRAGV